MVRTKRRPSHYAQLFPVVQYAFALLINSRPRLCLSQAEEFSGNWQFFMPTPGPEGAQTRREANHRSVPLTHDHTQVRPPEDLPGGGPSRNQPTHRPDSSKRYHDAPMSTRPVAIAPLPGIR